MRKNILVAGDWVIDENWMVTTENSPTSSHVGKQQFRSVIERPDAQILSLCAAGSIALMLHGALGAKADIYGLGLWDPGDTQLLASLFSEDFVDKQTPHSLEGLHVNPKRPTAVVSSNNLCRRQTNCLVGVHQCIRLFSISEKGLGTWRVLRVYKQTGGEEPQLLHRYDWEIPKNRLPAEKLNDNLEKRFLGNENVPKKFDVVVIVDHGKGAVTEGFIEKLASSEQCKAANWYARCKKPKADWINKVKDKLKFVLIGPKELDIDSDKWFFGDNLSRGAIKFLWENDGGTFNNSTDVLKKTEPPAHAVIALHTDNRLAALVPLLKPTDQPYHHDLSKLKIFSCSKFPKELPIRVGRHSVLFSSLILNAESESLPPGEYIVSKKTLEDALQASHNWCKDTQQALKDNTYWGHDENDETIHPEVSFRGKYRKTIAIKPVGGDFAIVEKELKSSLDCWNHAFNSKRCGTMPRSKTGYDKFQIWRSWSPVSNFISLVPQCRKEIGALKIAVNKFVSDLSPQKSLSSFIVGPPGWGKSYLVECLAKEMDMGFQEFNITHLASVDDLISCFDTISSLQTQAPERRLMIFWDEINALLESQHVYAYFLSPLWNGTYRRGSLTFRLQPCVWIFAGTHDLSRRSDDNARNDREKGVKVSDFMSRINGPIVHLDGDGTNAMDEGSNGLCEGKIDSERDRIFQLRQLEQLYVAVNLIKRNYPDISTISRRVLAFFRDVKLHYGIRSLEMIISRLKNVSHGKLTEDNLPLGELDNFKIWIEMINDKWKDEKNEEIDQIKIYGEPKKIRE